MQKINIVWFKRDFRLHDHLPLLLASQNGLVIPLYIIEPELWQQPDSSRRHWHFIHDCLVDLQKDLSKFNVPMIIRIGNATDVFEQLHTEIGIFTLWSHAETGNNWTYQRDINMIKWCQTHTVKWHECQTNGIVRRLKSRDNWAELRNNFMDMSIIPMPQNLQTISNIASDDLPSKNNPLFGSQAIGSVQMGGRTQALKTLESFLKERGRHYMQTISKPGISARNCSRLSTHITFGALSVREIEQATKTKIKILDNNTDTDAIFFKRNLAAFLSRLAWHCHFIQKLEQQPDIELKCMHPAFETMREQNFRHDFFESWKTGHTGYPLIDACMRSLHENGWITFRMRAMIVSFASYDLWLDWRQTAPFLAQLFTDYEPGIHYSQFQMQSGTTGMNAIRMYNPIKQSYDHDPNGKFIRRYIPELKNIPDSFIHEPWRIDSVKHDYPKPIVNHETAVKYARTEIANRRQLEGFRTEAQAINQKLGSRSKTQMRQIKKKNPNDTQLSLDF